MSAAPAPWTYETLAVEDLGNGVLLVMLNRPAKLNAMNRAFWREYRECFERIRSDTDIRAVVVSGNGKIFTAGLDLKDNGALGAKTKQDVARRAYHIAENVIPPMQETFTAMERCPQPVIVALHGACIGGGVDLATAACIRYAAADTFFSIKEVDVGLAADVGTLQRLPKTTANNGLVKELCYTARRFSAEEAQQLGLVTRVYKDRDATLAAAIATAKTIAEKSPVAVAGTKFSLNYARDHSVEDGLRQIALWNAPMLQSEDLMKSATAMMAKKKATFAKL